MADRTWNRIQPRLYDEWQLSKHARLILAHIITLSPNQYGVYDPSPFGRIREWWADIITIEQFDLAWDSLVEAGKIHEFRNRDCLWVIKKFKHEQFKDLNRNQRQGVLNFLSDYPEIIESFMNLYPMAFDTPSEPHPNPIESSSEGDCNGRPITDTDTDTDTEKKKTNTSAPTPEPPTPSQKPKPKPKDTIKAKPLYDETIKLFPPECESAREAFESMCASSNASGEISKQRLAGILAEILERTKGFTPEQINHGFYAATKASALNANYVFKAARGYEPPADDFFRPRNGSPEPYQEPIVCEH